MVSLLYPKWLPQKTWKDGSLGKFCLTLLAKYAIFRCTHFSGASWFRRGMWGYRKRVVDQSHVKSWTGINCQQ